MKTLTPRFLVCLLSLAFVWSIELPSLAQAPAAQVTAGSPSLDAYRIYATTHEGDVARGASLFADEQKLACAKCHSVDGRASKAGPDLFAVGDKQSSFYGVYLCGDYTSKRIFGLTQENGTLKTVRQIGSIPQGLVSFGADEAGHIYAVGYEGMIYQLDFSESRFDEIKPE